MLHSLHCLNAVRKEASKTLYNVTQVEGEDHVLEHAWPPGGKEAHLEHCMDRIMQSIMCHGDLTLSPLFWWEGFNIAIGRSGEHARRKWGPIRRWLDERGKSGVL